jgi:hypothetical protein
MKCSCTVCGKPIEYDAAAAGAEIACPHCGKPTRLAAYSAAPPPPPVPQYATTPAPRRGSKAWIVILVLVIGLIFVIPIMGLLAAIAIPNFIKARHASQRAACVANLRSIDGAKATWALDNKKTQGEIPTDADLFNGKYLGPKPLCPAGGTYDLGPVGEKPICTIPGHEF